MSGGGRGWRAGGVQQGVHSAWLVGGLQHTILQHCSRPCRPPRTPLRPSPVAFLPRPPAQGHPHPCQPRGTVLLLV